MHYEKLKDWRKIKELSSLKDLSTLPKEIYYLGSWNPQIFQNCVAVVGSRRMTDYGRRAIEKIVPQLVFAKKTVVSGFMYGVDQYAHQICVENGGKTVAVLGWGISHKLTGHDLILAQKIVDMGGLLISEWENQQPTHWTFPSRNRIVAALVSEVIIIEAGLSSGTFITARFALKLRKKIWAVPGPITSKTSAGTNYLIAQGKAKMWQGTASPVKVPDKAADPLLDLLENESLTTNEIARKLKLPIAQIGAQLSLLALSGQLIESGGKYYLNDAN